jgi:hypothetical protein
MSSRGMAGATLSSWGSFSSARSCATSAVAMTVAWSGAFGLVCAATGAATSTIASASDGPIAARRAGIIVLRIIVSPCSQDAAAGAS